MGAVAGRFKMPGTAPATPMPTPANLFAAIVFGLVGLVAFNYGRKNVLIAPMVTGLALMVFPYFVTATWAVYLTGAVLCAALWYWRE